MSTVMLVEDNTLMRLTIKKILIHNGYNVISEASNGEEAVTRYHETMPNLVIMDINMPQKGGLDAIRDIIKSDPNAKIVVCSVVDSQARIIEAIQSGAKGYIIKPFKPEDLLASVKQVIG